MLESRSRLQHVDASCSIREPFSRRFNDTFPLPLEAISSLKDEEPITKWYAIHSCVSKITT